MFIYDKMIPPADITELNIVLIDDWVVNAVRGTPYYYCLFLLLL